MSKYVYVDLETGGLPVSTGIYEVGLIATDKGRIIETLTIGLPINQERIPEGMGQGYACISDDPYYVKQFKQFVEKYPYPFVAHNASFDRGFLVHYGWVDKNAEFIDTCELFRKHLPKSEIANHKLGTIMEYYGVKVDGTLHTALSDLKGLLQCVNISGILGNSVEGFLEQTALDKKLLEQFPQLLEKHTAELRKEYLKREVKYTFLAYPSYKDFSHIAFMGKGYSDEKIATAERVLYPNYYSTVLDCWLLT